LPQERCRPSTARPPASFLKPICGRISIPENQQSRRRTLNVRRRSTRVAAGARRTNGDDEGPHDLFWTQAAGCRRTCTRRSTPTQWIRLLEDLFLRGRERMRGQIGSSSKTYWPGC